MRIGKNEVLRFRILMVRSLIKVQVQRGANKAETEALSVKDNTIKRGKVGLGVNNMTGVQFSDLTTSPEWEKAKSQAQNFEPIMRELEPTHVHTQCEAKYAVFGDMGKHTRKCEQVQNYCQEECSRFVSPIEQLQYYNCWKQCRDS